MSTRKTGGQGREFWIHDGRDFGGVRCLYAEYSKDDAGQDSIHVIEYSAHKAALDRLDEAEKLIGELSAVLEMIHKTPPVTDTEILINKCAFDVLELINKWKGEK